MVYLAGYAPGDGVRTMAATFTQVSTLFGCLNLEACLWQQLRTWHAALLADRTATESARKAPSQFREAVRLTFGCGPRHDGGTVR